MVVLKQVYHSIEDYREEFKESFPMLDEAKYFIRKTKSDRRSGKSCSNYSRIVYINNMLLSCACINWLIVT